MKYNSLIFLKILVFIISFNFSVVKVLCSTSNCKLFICKSITEHINSNLVILFIPNLVVSLPRLLSFRISLIIIKHISFNDIQ